MVSFDIGLEESHEKDSHLNLPKVRVAVAQCAKPLYCLYQC